jgi:DNA-binding LytR/AlgR family response regulator
MSEVSTETFTDFSGTYSLRIEFPLKKEKPVDNFFTIWHIVANDDWVEIYTKLPKPLLRKVCLIYMEERLPKSEFFRYNKSNMIKLRRIKSCHRHGKQIKLILIGRKPLYVSRLRVQKFIEILLHCPYIIRGKGLPPYGPVTENMP